MHRPSQQIRFCASRDGTRIAYATCGKGPPLLWVGHWVGHLNLDWDSPVWGPWLSLLTRRHTLVTYDWRGCGLSDREGTEFSWKHYNDDLEAVVAAAGLERFDLIATSASSCAVAISYAARHPAQVSHLVLCGSATRGILARAVSTDQFAEAETRLRAVELGWQKERPAYGQFFTSLHMPDATAEQFRTYNDLLRLTTTPQNAIALLRTFYALDVTKVVSEVRCPTLVLHARQDAIISSDEGRAVAAAIPGARFVPLEGRGHILSGYRTGLAAACRRARRFPPPIAWKARQARRAARRTDRTRAGGAGAGRPRARQWHYRAKTRYQREDRA